MRQLIITEKCCYDEKAHLPIINTFKSKDPVISELYAYRTHLFKIGRINYFTISIDATASMLQIIGLLVNDINIMKLTNVISTTTNDLYRDILSEFDDTIITRSFIKTCVMKYVYGSKPFSIAKELTSDYLKDLPKDQT